MRILTWAQAASSAGERVLPVAVISLPDQVDRRRLMVERGVPAGWLEPYWPATDLRLAQPDSLASFVDIHAYHEISDEPINGSVVGCAASHRLLSTWLSKTNLPLLLVLEDDIIPCTGSLSAVIINIARQLIHSAQQGGAFICHLGPRPDQLANSILRPVQFTPLCGSNQRIWRHVDPRPTVWRAHAYLLSRGAALRASRQEPLMRTVADDWIRRRDLGLISHLYLADPRLFMQDESISSTINHQAPRNNLYMIDRPILARLFNSLRFRTRMGIAKGLSKLPENLRQN